MSMPFEPEGIDALDESLLETMDQEELSDFRDDLQETLDQMMTLEPDPDRNEEAYYEWQDRINVLQDLIDAIDSRIGIIGARAQSSDGDFCLQLCKDFFLSHEKTPFYLYYRNCGLPSIKEF